MDDDYSGICSTTVCWMLCLWVYVYDIMIIICRVSSFIINFYCGLECPCLWGFGNYKTKI